MGVSSSSLDTVDESSALGVGSVESEPGDSTSAHGTGVSTTGSRDGSLLSSNDVEAATTKDEGRCAVGVEEVVAEEGQLAVLFAKIEGGSAGEGTLEGSSRGSDLDAADGGVVEVEGDGVVVEGKGGQLVELLDGERVGAGFGVEQADVVEHGEGAGRDCVGADGGAGVVLDAEAEGDDFEFEACWGRREFGGLGKRC